ncbi:MAG: shikimate dehydrogenase [Ferruginibacter sp.]
MKDFGLIGFPLEQSFSKKYFTEKFEKEGLADHTFHLFALKSINDFNALIAAHENLHGLAVTIPYKQAVMQFLTTINDEAKDIGAVNCIKVDGAKLTGYNTDILGFKNSFIPLLQSEHNGALVLGTGGASKAVQYVLKQMGLPFILVSRKPQQQNIISYTAITQQILDQFPVIINCTPVGMYPIVDRFPEIPYHLLSNRNYLYDLIYKPGETLFLQKGRVAGATVKNGLDMLYIQAEENWNIWNS